MSEQSIKDALAPFGWTCGPEFWKRYYSDPWVFNLANAVELLQAGRAATRSKIESEREACIESSRDTKRTDWARDTAAAQGWAFDLALKFLGVDPCTVGMGG